MDHFVQLRFPVPSEETPRAFARGLLLKGVRATQLAEVAVNEMALDVIAKIILRYSGTPSEMPAPAAARDNHRVLLPDVPKHCSMLRIHGATRHDGKSLADSLMVLVTSDARELLENEKVTGTDEATMYSFAFVPTEPFARESAFEKLVLHKSIRTVLKRKYSKFSERDTDASLIVGLLRNPSELKALARVRGFKWIVFLHRPVDDLCGHPRVLQICFSETGGIKVNTAHLTDETMWKGDGAFAVLSH